MMSKPKYIILTGLFCSVVASDTSHFYLLFSIFVLARVDFLYDKLDLWLCKRSPGQKVCSCDLVYENMQLKHPNIFSLSMITQKESTSQTDQYLVSLSSKTYVFEDKLTKY